jgi:hypothetical protein
MQKFKDALFCMNNDVHHTQHDDYVDRKHLRIKQCDLDARLRIVDRGKGESTQDETEEQVNSEDTFFIGKSKEGASFDWKELAEVTSKGKEAIDEEEEDEGEGASEEEDEEDDEDFADYDEGSRCVLSLFGVLMPKGRSSIYLHEFLFA